MSKKYTRSIICFNRAQVTGRSHSGGFGLTGLLGESIRADCWRCFCSLRGGGLRRELGLFLFGPQGFDEILLGGGNGLIQAVAGTDFSEL